MRAVVAHLFSSIDGVVASPHLFQFDSFGPEEEAMMGANLAPIDASILGRVIYEEWADYWPQHNEDFGLMINPVRKYVATRTLHDPLSWENSTIIDGDLVDFARRLREEEGGDIAVNGISVIRQLLEADLLDALILTVHPVFAGQGQRVFDDLAAPLRLELVDSQITSVGNAILTYRKKRDANPS